MVRSWKDMYVRGRSQLSTFMKAYTAYARGEGVRDHHKLSPRKSTFIFNHWQCIIKYCTCLECGQYAHICRTFMYNNTFEALFLTSKYTKRGFLWTQTVAPHRSFCKAAQRRYRIFSTFYNKKWDIRNTWNNEKSDSVELIRGLQRPLTRRGSNVHFYPFQRAMKCCMKLNNKKNYIFLISIVLFMIMFT